MEFYSKTQNCVSKNVQYQNSTLMFALIQVCLGKNFNFDAFLDFPGE